MSVGYNSGRVFTLVINLFIISVLFGQQTTIKYIPSSSIIANPELGWYDDYYSHTGGSNLSVNYRPLNARELIENRENDKITLIMRLFYLHEFLDQTAVSTEYLSKMQADFDSIRAAGVKCIIRFAYSASQNADIWDATPDKVFSHIESLSNVLSSNSEIIAGIQAGFIGAWGEWYYTKNFAGTGYVPSATDQENRRTLVESLLDILPENIIIQCRTPAIMRNITQTDEPITEEDAFNGSYKSRVGHHNDCFLANSSDYGTYVNLEEDIAYLHETTKYTITGGETCDASNQYSDCKNGVPRLKELHWTYLNRDYNRAVYSKWEQQGCYDEINISFGYRVRLVSATIPDSTDAGSSLNFSFEFSNDGYAAPTQYKPIQIVLTHTLTGEQSILDYTGTNDDIRYWLPGDIQSDGFVTIHDSLADGNYSLAIVFPDQSPKLAYNPAYSIQLANAGIWDSEKGFNELNHIVSVGAGGEGALPMAPVNVTAEAVSETQIDLTWLDGSGDATGFEIMRSKGNENVWIQIATPDSNTTEYSNENLSKGTKYQYIIRSMNVYGNSSWSDIVSATTLGVSAYNTLKSQSVAIYPNPLNNSDLIVYFPDESEKLIVISKISGEKIFETATRQDKFQISREIFKPGMYIITFYQGNGILNRKLIVL
jgi:hypothetical protein